MSTTKKKMYFGAIFLAGVAGTIAMHSTFNADRKLLLLVATAMMLWYVLTLVSEFARIRNERPEVWLLVGISTTCYALTWGTLSEIGLELTERWSSGDAGFAMMFFLRLIILPCSAIGFVTAILAARMKLKLGLMLSVFHGLACLTISVPMLMYG